MDQQLIDYLFSHYSNLAPLEVVAKIKYPYLNEIEQLSEKRKIAEYLLENYESEIFINNCPNCKQLARTPKAKQCRHCGHDWH
jgi:hypothetical protein